MYQINWTNKFDDNEMKWEEEDERRMCANREFRCVPFKHSQVTKLVVVCQRKNSGDAAVRPYGCVVLALCLCLCCCWFGWCCCCCHRHRRRRSATAIYKSEYHGVYYVLLCEREFNNIWTKYSLARAFTMRLYNSSALCCDCDDDGLVVCVCVCVCLGITLLKSYIM